MHLIQLFIPSAPQTTIDIGDVIATIQREMTERHGGMTAYLNSPAKGLWFPVMRALKKIPSS
ncbi:hypothetical protein [Rhizobium lentis]|uniref:hypothetical protein n=1 Tax=Rhizobium lentis TaxID=1138194 RepID=UPI002180B5A1|nr:hypothetical protein [Rhizobium lentis]